MNLTQRIMVYGLDEGQIELIGKNLPASSYDIFETDEVTDLIALNSVSCIINADALSQDDKELLWSFYRETN